MRRSRVLATFALASLLAGALGSNAHANYNADDCAEIAGTLDMHWRAVAGPKSPCTAIVATNGSYEDAEDGFVDLGAVESSDANCRGLGSFQFLLWDGSTLAGYDNNNFVPMSLSRSDDGKCFQGHWRSGAQDYVVHVSADAFEGTSAPLCGDVDASETIKATDALLTLRKAVGQPVPMTCGANVNLDTCTDYYTLAMYQLDQAGALLTDIGNDKCGDGAINLPGEHCDGADLGGASCNTLDPLRYGTLACGDDCRFDASDCHVCNGGAVVAGLCWYQGDWGADCTETCAARGLVFDEAMVGYFTGNSSTGGSRCGQIQQLLPLPSDELGCGFSYSVLFGGGPSYSDGAGCVSDRSSCLEHDFLKIERTFFDAQGPITADVKHSSIARVCACRP